jgi:DNA repair protein SbcD/Mre11
MKFLHIADVHLGCTRYNLSESPRDFYDAWLDVIERYAIGEQVDFVVMAGDFFHKKSVPPETMDYAVEGLTRLKSAGIPVLAIEGNHDQRPMDNPFSWLRSLSKWGLVHLLEPTTVDGKMFYEPWDEKTRRGGFIDIGRARIFGSDWYGASGNWAIPILTESIKANRREGAFHLLMLHTDVEGHQVHPIPALSVSALSELKSAVDYVALGHTHQHYVIDNWAFNPGSIEVTNITEFRETRGAFVVEVDEQNTLSARHVSDYVYRPFQQLPFSVDNFTDAKEITRGVLEMVATEARVAEEGKPQPIIEIGLRGRLGFPNSLLELSKIRDETRRITGALHVKVKNHTIPMEYHDAEPTPDDPEREALERRVIDQLVVRDLRYKSKQGDIADAVIGAKRMALEDDEPERIAEFIAAKSCPKPLQNSAT